MRKRPDAAEPADARPADRVRQNPDRRRSWPNPTSAGLDRTRPETGVARTKLSQSDASRVRPCYPHLTAGALLAGAPHPTAEPRSSSPSESGGLGGTPHRDHVGDALELAWAGTRNRQSVAVKSHWLGVDGRSEVAHLVAVVGIRLSAENRPRPITTGRKSRQVGTASARSSARGAPS